MKKRILTVDNIPHCIVPIREFLERQGYEVISATGLAEALAVVARTPPDVAILDLRLIDNASPVDFSGLELARALAPEIPKIILTAYPSVKAVRQALGLAADGLPLTVAFLKKSESLQVLLRAVRLALVPSSPELLQCFGVSAMHALPERVVDLGPDVAAAKMGEFIAAQKADFSHQVKMRTRDAAHYRRMSMWSSATGFAVVLVAIILGLSGKTSMAAVSMVGSMLTHIVSALFTRRDDKAQECIRISFQQTQDLMQLGALLELCGCFETPEKRDLNRQAILDVFLDRINAISPKRKQKTAAA